MTEPQLQQLMRDADELCSALYKLRNEPSFSRLCVNWGDFGCVEAIWCRNESGMEWPVVRIEEASPEGNETARHFIRDGLTAKGHGPGLEVRMEW